MIAADIFRELATQASRRPLTEDERALANAMEETFASRDHDFSALARKLGEREARQPSGARDAWTVDVLRRELEAINHSLDDSYASAPLIGRYREDDRSAVTLQPGENDPVQNRIDEGLLGAWYVVAKSVDVKKEQPVAVKALGRDLVLWRGADGKVRCVADYCPHRAARLSLGRIVGDAVSCRYHGVTVDGTGTIIKVPGMADCALEGRRAVDAYAVEEAADGVFVYFPSAIAPQPPALPLPKELTDPSFTHFLCTAPWAVNHRYVFDNLVDPMHGIFLHADSFTLGRGVQQDTVEIKETPTGFIVKRVAQQEVNFDWAEIIIDPAALYGRVLIPYPPAAGPGGPLFIITFVTPVDKDHCRIFFWRTRMVGNELERETWRFLFRAKLEARHWFVLEQDREVLEQLPSDARNRESLYQHDLGVTRLRRIMREIASAQLKAEAEAPPQPQRRRQTG